MAINDVSAATLIAKVASQLKSEGKIASPEYSQYIKTGSLKDTTPDEKDWYFTRVAAVLRHLYIHKHAGIRSLQVSFGGNKAMGHMGNQFHTASGAIIRRAVRDLTACGYLKLDATHGRIVTPAGKALLEN